jgi:hypothetical protein
MPRHDKKLILLDWIGRGREAEMNSHETNFVSENLSNGRQGSERTKPPNFSMNYLHLSLFGSPLWSGLPGSGSTDHPKHFRGVISDLEICDGEGEKGRVSADSCCSCAPSQGDGDRDSLVVVHHHFNRLQQVHGSLHRDWCKNSFFLNIFWGDFFFVLYSTLLHLPPLRFHCADGC